MLHAEESPLAGNVVKLRDDVPGIGGQEYRVEDWWDRVSGQSWMNGTSNPACLDYALRSGQKQPSVPLDDEVLYGKVGSSGKLVHVSEVVESTVDVLPRPGF